MFHVLWANDVGRPAEMDTCPSVHGSGCKLAVDRRDTCRQGTAECQKGRQGLAFTRAAHAGRLPLGTRTQGLGAGHSSCQSASASCRTFRQFGPRTGCHNFSSFDTSGSLWP